MQPVDIIKDFIINNFLFGSEEELSNNVNLFEKGIIDSTGIIELISFLEENFKISIEDEELIMDNFSTLNNIKEFLQKKTALKAG